MKFIVAITALALTALTGVACNETKESDGASKSSTPEAEGTPSSAGDLAIPPSGAGKVLETMDSGGYTYVKLQLGESPIWAAGPQTALVVGDEVTIPRGMPMKNFYSKTLDRTFPLIYFVGSISK